MRRNVGPIEWKLRAGAGIVLLGAALFIEWPGAWEGLAGALGAVLLATGVARWCPLNYLAGRRAA